MKTLISMPSEEAIRLVSVTRTYLAQVHQRKKLGNGMNAVQNRTFESHRDLKPQQGVDSMGKDSGGELLQGSDYIDKLSDFDLAHNKKTHHDQPVVVDKGLDASMDLRNRIARQWRCPAFAWKAMEAIPVRNLFRVTQSSMEGKPPKDADETFVKNGDALLSAVEDGGMSERKLVSIVLAFQRWRHIQLKNILGQELRKVLEQAREDEATLTALETELEHTEQQLATSRANSSRLRSQLAAAMNSSHHENGYSVDNTTVSKSDRQMIPTMEGLNDAETEIQQRDNQIQQLKDRIRSMEDQSELVDERLCRLEAERSNLQAENNCNLRENMNLLEQLSSRDKEVMKQVEEMERLKAWATRLVEQQNSKQHQIESIIAEHNAEVKILQEQLQQASGAKSSKEVELATSAEHCSRLRQEKDNLVMQLQEAEKRADFASTRAQELCSKLQCNTYNRAESSTVVASEMGKHLKTLTEHVRELETTINATDAQPSTSHADGSSIRYRIEDTRATPDSDQVYHTFPQNPVSGLLDGYPLYLTCNGQDQRHMSFSSKRDNKLLEPASAVYHSPPQYIFLDKIENWIAWKWRWAASSARAEHLARKLHGFNQKTSENSHLDDKQQKVQELMQRLITGNLTCMEHDLNTMVTEHKLVPLILSAWRAFTRTSMIERKAISRSALLDKMLESLPWWIRRVRDRRQLERTFFQWLVLTLSNRQANSHQDMRNRLKSKVVEEPVSYEDLQTPSKPTSSNKILNRITRSDRLVIAGSDENAVRTQRRPQQAPAADANLKRRLGYNRINQLPNDSQTRALQTLQATLQQEVTELRKILCQEIPLLERITQIKGRPVTAPTKSSNAKARRPDGKKVLKSVLGVCNNLTLALTNARGKLNPRILSEPVHVRGKLSPHVLADSKGPPNTSLLKDVRRKFMEGQSPQSSPRLGGLISERPERNSRATWEGWSTQIVPSGRRPTNINPAQESSTYESPYQRSQDCSRTPKTKKISPESRPSTSKFKRGSVIDKSSLRNKRSPRTTNPGLGMSVMKTLLADGASNASLEDKKLIGSAFDRLIGTKISKLRGVQAVV